MSGWVSEIQRQYDFIIYRHEARSQGIWLETNKGAFFLYPFPKTRMPKMSFVKDIYKQMGESRALLPIVPAHNGEDHILINEQYYYMIGWPLFETDWVDYTLLGDSLATFHHLSAKRLTISKNRFSEWGTWPKIWRSKIGHLQKFRQAAVRRIQREAADDFDPFFVDNFDHFLHLGSKSISCLEKAGYSHVCQKCEAYSKLGYIRFEHDQYVITPQGNVFFTDPFSWHTDIRVRDMAQLIKADVRDFGWNPHHIHAFLDAYHRRCQILPEEFTMMYAMFLYPGQVFHKLEAQTKRPFLLASEREEIEWVRSETNGVTSQTVYEELKRTEVLIAEFPRLSRDVFGVRIEPIR